MSDLQDLFARLKAQGADSQPVHSGATQPSSIWVQPQQHAYQPASVSSPLFSPPIHTPNPIHSADVLSPAQPASASGTPAPSDQNRTSNLLNLLKFHNQDGQSQVQANTPRANLQNATVTRSGPLSTASISQPRPLSAQNLAAPVQRQASGSGLLSSPLVAAGSEQTVRQSPPAATSAGTQQKYLLNLLRKSNSTPPVAGSPVNSATPAEADERDPSINTLTRDFTEVSIKPTSPAIQREPTPVRHFGSPDVGKTAFEAPQPSKTSIFNYVNPFDQLHTSSPLNKLPKSDVHDESKKMEILKHNRDPSSTLNDESAAPAWKTRKLTAEEIPDPHIQGSELDFKGQSVSERLEGVAEKIDKQVEDALANAESQATPSRNIPAIIGDGGDRERKTKKETVQDDNGIDSSWESAEDSANEKKEFHVRVYNFPMKPFVSIQIKDTPEPALPARQDNFMVIAQLKKEFDQIDRGLATASQSHIVYAQTGTKKDNAGFRVIRQDTGDHKQVFRSSGERVFSVQICTPPGSSNDVESVLGTGINGSIFWTSLAKSRPDLFEEDDVEAHGFIMPPVNTAEENTSGSQVKTRAKLSSRHPEFFGMARGKHIHIVSPETVKERAYCDPATRKVDSEKFLAEHGLRINTGKAGKDFCFSEDDSVIASLDKSGHVKFWDIRDLTNRANDISELKHEPVELREPLWTLFTAASGSRADEKPSVSSIALLDKERPHTKGVAMRYMLVGFKQNHILQLWDLGLGKAVQEIRLPHEKDSDGICSIGYHPKTGVLAVGHPTRNSVYFIHLSAPKYNIPFLDQARYITLLARNDHGLPKPDSTAIMSGLREFSFAQVGQIRSIDMLKIPVDNVAKKDAEDETLFELYSMHSKGVFGMSIKRADLGWNIDNRMINPVDAVKSGVVEVDPLKLPDFKETPVPSEVSSNTETPARKSAAKKESKKHEAPKVEIIKKEADAVTASVTNGAERKDATEQHPKQIQQASRASAPPSVNPQLMTPDSYAMAAQRSREPAKETNAPDAVDAAQKAATASRPSTVKTSMASGDDDSQAALSRQFDSLYQRLDADKRVMEAAGSAKQDAMLRLVSNTLTENVETSLHRIIGASIEKEVIPTLIDTTAKLVDSKLGELLPQQLNYSVQHEMKIALPLAIQQSLKDTQIQRSIADQMANQIASKVQQQVQVLLQKSIPNLVTQTSQQMFADLETRTSQQLHQADARHQQDHGRIEELSSLVRSLSETIQGMAGSQAAFQEQILHMQQARKQDGEASKSATSTSAATRSISTGPRISAEEQEVSNITKMLMEADYESATIAWLQSARQGELFDSLFVRVNPQYLQQVTPLVALSVSAAITASFATNVDQRLDWLSAVLSQIDVKDQDILDVAPKIMDVLSQRLQGAYMQISEERPESGVLRKISALNRQVTEVRKMTG